MPRVGDISPNAASGSELKNVIEAERSGIPFLLYRDDEGSHHLFHLRASIERVTVGRRDSNDIVFDWDSEVSRTHAEFERFGGEWAISDDGLSRNGTYVNGARLSGRRRLNDGDTVRFGETLVVYRGPSESSTAMTSKAKNIPTIDSLTPTQKRVLTALCRPYKHSEGYATPATNQEIATEIFLSVDAVKTHLRALFQTFEISGLPQNQKRVRLVECAFQLGLVVERDL